MGRLGAESAAGSDSATSQEELRKCVASSATSDRARLAPLLLAGLEKLEYRGYDSAGISVLDGDRIDAVRAVGNLSALRDAIDGRGAPDSQAAAARRGRRAAGARDRHRPHPLGDPRPRHRGERPPALRHHRPRPHRRQRDRRELHRAQGTSSSTTGAVFTSETDAEVIAHLVAQLLRRRPRRRGAPGLRRAARPLRVRRDERRRARRARRRAQGVPADRRPRRRRAVHRAPRSRRSCARRAASSTSETTRSSCCGPTASSS